MVLNSYPERDFSWNIMKFTNYYLILVSPKMGEATHYHFEKSFSQTRLFFFGSISFAFIRILIYICNVNCTEII